MAISCVIYFNAAGAALLKRVWRRRPQRISCFEFICLVTHFLLIFLSSFFFSRFYLFFFLTFFLPSFHTSSCLSTICLFYFFLTTPFLPSSPPSSLSPFPCLLHLFLSSSIFHFKSRALLFFSPSVHHLPLPFWNYPSLTFYIPFLWFSVDVNIATDSQQSVNTWVEKCFRWCWKPSYN